VRIGTSLFLIALGAVLRFAVQTQHTHGFNVGTAGVILMIVGAAGLLLTGVWMMGRRRTDVIARTPYDTRTLTTYQSRDPLEPM
jgi:membrane-bound ClpP family serine protease